jgi:uncharacterized protein YndB with AHSA1/START domain
MIAAMLAASLVAPSIEPAGREISFDVTVDKPPAVVFELWTTQAGIRKFLAPSAVVEARVGGRYQLAFEPASDPEGRRHGTYGVAILKLVPGREIVTEWTFPPLGPEFATKPYPTRLEVALEAAGDGRTRVRLAHRGFPREPRWDAPFATFRDEIWPLVLNRLIVYCRDDVAPAWGGSNESTLSRVVHKEALVAASPAQVWTAWTTSAGIMAFLGADARIDARVGGLFEIYFDPAAAVGERGSEGCRFLAVEPGRFFTAEWNAPPQLPTIRPLHHLVTVALEPEGEGTRVRLDALGFGAGAEWTKTQQYFDNAWGMVLGALFRHFEGATTAQQE